MKNADICLIDLAVMGEGLVMNMEPTGFTVVVSNHTTENVDRFVNGRAAGKNIIGCHSLQELATNFHIRLHFSTNCIFARTNLQQRRGVWKNADQSGKP